MSDESSRGDLGDQIAKAVQKAYQELSPVCKPVVRSNGLKEWTVLAGIVAISTNELSRETRLRVVSIGTGVKALPDEALARSQGKMVHDCHAEILALRGFNAVLLKHAGYLQKNTHNKSDLLERSDNGNFFLKPEWELALYVSTLPCGDASMNSLGKTADTESVDHSSLIFQENDQIQWVDERIRTIMRGRFNYNKLGIVRTKPGRYDSQITYSKSCSDKLCAKQVTSILNSLTWEIMERPVFLRYLVSPKETHYQDLCRSFRDRLVPMSFRPLEFLTSHNSFCDGKSDSADEPSSMSSVKLFIELPEDVNVEQAILNGVRNGFYTKGSKPLRRNCESVVSRHALWKLYTELRPESGETTYLSFKATQEARNKLIRDTRYRLSADGWINTHRDDCQG